MYSECYKVCYYKPKKSTFFRIINQQPKFCAIYFSKINLDVHVSTENKYADFLRFIMIFLSACSSTKINISTFYKGEEGGQ